MAVAKFAPVVNKTQMYTETDRSQKMATRETKSTRGNATRRRIVEQSAAVFNKNGYSGTSMSALMAVTGLEKGGLYRHFDSKEDLAAAAFDYAGKRSPNHGSAASRIVIRHSKSFCCW